MIFFKKNKQVTFDRIYHDHKNQVRGVLFRMLIQNAQAEILDELEQEVFIKAWNALGGFSFKSTISTWLYRISVNTAIDHLRKQKIQHTPLDEKKTQNLREHNQDLKIDVAKLLASIDDKHRAVLILYYFEEKSIEEISNILETKVGTIKSRLTHARKKAKVLYER